ncbi:hypothetical protein SAMN02745121_09074 [Nannocystis exedens]|uniref:Uncharacterized protein n=1 Tax=Nannocystis exedens TaxID=54 RepID=A0A1I2J2E1_9BACT|nr:hypothetical protein [Nannocystis exedens]PCC72498.1 hypothetical protein NAEX_05578 [Nannocystis exedens]SFF47106.1 hypothetical protein SAMN02745121_09074 [Nannocystis exedens]
MSIPKRGARRIIVDGQEYGWQLRRRPTPDQRSGRTPLLLAVAARDRDGPALLVRLHRPHPGNQVGLTSAAVTPREVAELVREGLRAGWQPARPGRQFILEPRAAARGPQTWPRGQVPCSREQLLALARGRESCDRLRLADTPTHVSWPAGGGFQPCAIVINDRDLIEWVREVERPHAAREIAERRRDDPGLDLNVDGLVGDYLHLTRRELALPSRHLFEPSDDIRHSFGVAADDPIHAKTTVLQCTCGILECWFLLVRITLFDAYERALAE